MAAEPDRDRSLHRQRVQAGLVDPVPSAVERDQILRPERAEQSDLLLDPAAAGLEVLAERPVLDRVPADSDAETETASRPDLHPGTLLGPPRVRAVRPAASARGAPTPLGA